MKRWFIGALCLVLGLTACAVPNPFRQQRALKPSYWGQRLTADQTEVPMEARGDSESALWGITTQGNFFIQNHAKVESYIWNEEKHRRIELTPANIEAEDLMQHYLEAYAATHKDAVSSDWHGQELLEKYLSADGAMRMMPRSIGMTFGGDYIAAQDRVGKIWLIDAETGKMYGSRERWYRSAYENTLLATGASTSSQVFLLDKEMNSLTFKSYARTEGFEGSECSITAASFLPDGSICVVLRDMQMDMEKGEICKLLIDRPDGTQELYDLGRISFQREPDQIYSVDSQRIVLMSSTMGRNGKLYYVDCETGEVSFMSHVNDQITLEPYTKYLNSQGMVEFPQDDSRNYLMVLEAMGDGQTILLQDEDGRFLLFKPDTKECQFLLNGGGFLYSSIALYFMGNGYDRVWYATVDGDREQWAYYTLRVLS